jgi:hypothetical protein
MKKSILIFSTAIVILSLMACSFSKSNDTVTDQNQEIAALDTPVVTTITKKDASKFFYDVRTRFKGITKQDLSKVKSINDFIGLEEIGRMVHLKSTEVILVINDEQSHIRVSGNTKTLNAAQLELLRSSPYSTNFVVRADYQQMNDEIGELEDSYSTPHLTIVPEKEAVYAAGMDALIDYLKENSKEVVTFLQEDKLKPAKLYFTVTKEGAISNLKLDRSCGDVAIDYKMVELITNMPGIWEPAEDSTGRKIDQELVFSFGLEGC